ncbi:MAG: Protein-L-isoaspartate O-methyltransferase [Alphaproteobacteria bacterium MarineAlpha6_Bin2]|nr:MAG: Protein-L-isoaspartate O-methyltransferase [Alphaproteobacteria bacterium MarineAlpha6_Bin2]
MNANINKIHLILELRKLGIINTDILSVFEDIPREKFIDKELSYKAYHNRALPISCNQTISQPGVVAMMTQILEPKKNYKVLEIGTGSGYQTAVLSKLFRIVYTIERYKLLFQNAKNVLEKLKVKNIVFYHGDGLKGWPAKFLFDRIIITALAKEMPKYLIDQLSDGGVMVLPLVYKSEQFITRVTKIKNNVKIKKYWRVRFVPLLPGIK